MRACTVAGVGLNFTEPKGQYDASAYKGISFWAKKFAAVIEVAYCQT